MELDRNVVVLLRLPGGAYAFRWIGGVLVHRLVKEIDSSERRPLDQSGLMALLRAR